MVFWVSNGLVSGLLLAAFLAIADGLFQTSTFQVLIDVNYIPMFANLPSVFEFFIHLAISIVVTGCFIFFYPRYSARRRYTAGWFILFVLLYFVFSSLSLQPITLIAGCIWAIGHLLFILFLVIQIKRAS